MRGASLITLALLAGWSCASQDHGARAAGQQPPIIFSAVLHESGVETRNISTEEMEATIASGEVVVLDTRPRLEWAISHIPGALNVAPKPGTSMALYVSDVAEIDRLVHGNKAQQLVLYCNGPFCGKSKRLSEELLTVGYSSVRRYQLGAPVWRALGKVMVIEPEGIRYVLARDQTAAFIDVREKSEFSAGSVANATNIPRSLVLPGKDVGELKAAKDDGRLPMNDHNTRIVVFGRDPRQARHVAEAIAREAFHNVSFFAGTYEELVHVIRE
ncbi:MAG TPA: rhodanese-like domain-containing protein [Thermoanaerobaculia bacterium]|nr:rhodanese-like domain-containing protein [Thermoanaerobaculia bacterium]